MNAHVKRFALAAVISVCSLVAVGVCSAEVRRDPVVEVATSLRDETPYRPLFVLADAGVDAGAAAPSVPPGLADPDPVQTAVKIYDAFKAGKYVTAASLAVILLVLALRKLKIAWFQTDRGGAVLAVLMGEATAFIGFEALGALTGKSLVITALAGLAIAGGAAGIRHLVLNLIWPPDKQAPEVDL